MNAPADFRDFDPNLLTAEPLDPSADEIEYSLLDFAASWLERWTNNHGTVTLGSDGRLWIGHPEYSFTPAAAQVDAHTAGLPETVRQLRRDWDRAAYQGRMSELQDLLDVVPDGDKALRKLIELAPHLGLAPFTRKHG